ncbi:serine hydrolase domain-containing protein [Nonomuraea aurantiaca]|uniref:serine hydrolase domain-containing protein n=1 Tax=Nonomuraea aurantiaca TaxID=2878562 RepID=UPI001CDA38DB|nr:serine hydrolase domain-containing protein [Nonomuraea aurantiaca]MCA2227050.1 beta-lactamase family protein [Nonomuraea aurantiaca]
MALLAPIAALLIAGCAFPTEASFTAFTNAWPTPTPTATASASTPSALKPIDPAMFQSAVEGAAKKLMVPGALVLLRTPQGTFRAAVGTTELGTARPPTTRDHFRIASNTKTMTSALILLLAQDGELRLSDPVSAYVPGVPNGEHITIAELLKMRSGLYNYTNAPELAATMDADPGKAQTPQAMLDIAFRRPPTFAPGTSFEYSNTNYVLLGLVAEKAGGHPLAQQFRDRLFAPLALAGSSLPAADDSSLPRPYSHGYMYGGTAYAMVDRPYPADMRAAARSGKLRPVDYTHQNPSYASAGGGVISTADDLATWIQALVTGKVLNPAFQRQWLRSPRAEDPAAPPGGKEYGYGIAYQRFGPKASMYYHGGELPGFNSFIGQDTDHEVTLVIWTNLTLSPGGRTTAQALLPTVLNQVYAGLSLPTGVD